MNSKKKKKSDTNSAGHTGSSSNRFFEKRRSSSKSDVETARFNRIEGLTSSRNLENKSKVFASAKVKNSKTVDNRLHEEHGKADSEVYFQTGPLLNTFSTIKPLDQFEILNSSTSKQQKNLLKQLEKHVRYPTCMVAQQGANRQDSFEFTKIESRNVSSNPTIAFEPANKSGASLEGKKQSENVNGSNVQELFNSNNTKTMMSNGDHGHKLDEERKPGYKKSKKNLKSNSQDGGYSLRKESKSRELITKKVIDNITKILESINKSTAKQTPTKEEKSILESINSLHVFEFKNACVLGLDLKDCQDIHKLADSSLLGSVYFKQLVHNIGILRVRNCTVNFKFISQVTHSNIILLSLNQCSLTSLSFLKGLDSLKLLNVSDNQLKSLCSVQKCANLSEIYANNNQLTSLADLRSLRSLKILSIAHNSIVDVAELTSLRKTSLSFVKLHGNPFCLARDYITAIQALLPKVKVVDFDTEVAVR